MATSSPDLHSVHSYTNGYGNNQCKYDFLTYLMTPFVVVGCSLHQQLPCVVVTTPQSSADILVAVDLSW